MTPGEVPVDDAVWLARSVDRPFELDRMLDNAFRLSARTHGPEHPRTLLALGAYAASITDPQSVEAALEQVVERYADTLAPWADDAEVERLDEAVVALHDLLPSRVIGAAA